MKTTDYFDHLEHTFDAPTAVARLDLALRGMAHDTGTLAGELFNAGVRGDCTSSALSPAAMFLHAKCGCDVEIMGNLIELRCENDWRFLIATPRWLLDFEMDCYSGQHPLLDGVPTYGDVRPIDLFAGVHH